MSAQNENDIIAVEIIGDDIPVITQAELLATDYTGDEGAEFLCELFNTINYFESYIDNPEELCCPDESQDGEIPYIILIEKLNDLINFTWAKRTFTRMTRLAGAIQETQRLTQLQKSEHTDYIQCPNCLDYFLNKRNGLEKHMMNPICAERNARMFVKGNNDKKLPSGKYLHTVMVMDNLIGRSIAYKKNIEPELEEEKLAEGTNEDEEEDEEKASLIIEYNELVKRIKKIQSEDHFDIVEGAMIATDEGEDMDEVSIGRFTNDGIREVIENLKNALGEEEGEEEDKIDDYAYVLKTYELDGEYGGLFEVDGNKEFNTTDEAQEAFDVAISTEKFSMIEFIRIDPNSNEHRETIIDVWNNYYKSEFTYVVKVYLGDDYQHNYIYNEKGSWSDQEEAKIAFNKAIECQEYSSIELVCKDDDYDEQLMDEWETDDTCYECGRPLPDREYLNGEDMVCYRCWEGETTKTDSEDEEDDECEFCAWRSEYPESHIQYGNVKCEYITDKYNIVFNEDGEIHSVLRNPV